MNVMSRTEYDKSCFHMANVQGQEVRSLNACLKCIGI